MMKSKLIITLIFFFILSVASYSQVIDLGQCQSDKLSETGFDKMKEAIGDARIVIIGEQNHGVGTDYENFAFMVKFLHEEMGFNVIAQEFSFFDFGLINSKLNIEGSSQEFRKAMYWPQGKAKENDLLFDYLDSQRIGTSPINMEGFDPRFFQREIFHTYFDSLLNNKEYTLLPKEDISFQSSTLNNVLTLEYRDTLTSSSDKVAFLKNIDSIISNMLKQAYDPRTIQLVKNVKSFAKNAWNIEDYSDTDVDRYFEREFQMAENIIWLSDIMYPNEKIIVHIHNGHAAKNIDLLAGAIPDSLVKMKLNTGSLLNENYGDDCFYIATTYYSGTYCGWDYKEKEIPKPKSNSIESELHNEGYKYAFVDLPNYPKYEFYMYHSEFNTWVEDRSIKAPFGKIFDAVIFIDEVNLPGEKDANPD